MRKSFLCVCVILAVCLVSLLAGPASASIEILEVTHPQHVEPTEEFAIAVTIRWDSEGTWVSPIETKIFLGVRDADSDLSLSQQYVETVVEAATSTIQVQLRAPAKQGILNLAIMVNWVRAIERVILDLRHISIQVGSASTITEESQVRLTSTITKESSAETSSYMEPSVSTTSLPEPSNQPNAPIVYVIIAVIAVIVVAALLLAIRGSRSQPKPTKSRTRRKRVA
jgi:hypothetical protein